MKGAIVFYGIAGFAAALAFAAWVRASTDYCFSVSSEFVLLNSHGAGAVKAEQVQASMHAGWPAS